VRLAHVGRVSEDFARRLAASPLKDRVLHPALPSCPGHAFWQRDINGSSGVFSIVVQPNQEARLDDALTALRVFAIGASWGGTRSLIAPMAVENDRTVNPWMERGTLVRISIGLEAPADL
jgi:cystathionine beta-lyase